MGGISTSVKEQIQKLTARGMELDYGIEKTEEILLDIGYYRLGFYWNPFEIDGKHNFKEGTKFSDVVNLYYLDVDLKTILGKALNRIEINLRTQIIYNVSNEFPLLPTWFASKRVMQSKFVDEFPKFYNDKFKDKNKSIKKHHSNYPNDLYAPAWKTLEFLSFGSIYTIFYSLKDEKLKRKISSYYGINSVHTLQNFLQTIIFVRNICAHSGLLYDSNTPKEISTTPFFKFNNNNKHSLDSSIKVILYFLERISANRKKIIEQEIDSLFDSYQNNDVVMKIITEKIGYRKK
ncbi:Abortive infection bacteriophage resistance protein [Flavobacterium fryxellicola]|uniref:DNA-binding protein n=1 Tax=Flavobacterium fryxellicola TaxID=249352 RepID=A0A167XQY2_9FLAO|nr:Abi family protein [Flavobacterium fryxellicola]OAB28608.1 DNA-binding protein [Flavobacterium fryxellicola]SHN51409.1 Abortive infection bacteriophage resistance protein [Flavobacterium fryxellicola]